MRSPRPRLRPGCPAEGGLDRVVGDLELPPGVAVVAAANPPEQAAGGWDLSPPLANRFCHLSWALNTQGWIDGMIQGWPVPSVPRLPDNWEAGIPASRTLVAAFIRHRPHLLLQLPESEEQAGKAWPSPRSWDMAARLLAASNAAQAGMMRPPPWWPGVSGGRRA